MNIIDKKISKMLWKDLQEENEFQNKKPLLAHYTTMQNFDHIIGSNELWFSNPLNMNDSDELAFGMNQGAYEFRNNERLKKACGNDEIFIKLVKIFDGLFSHFDKYNVLDTYVLCFSEHEKNDNDGKLSMWRGYGENGSGISFVINTNDLEPNPELPIILSAVHYATKEEMYDWIKNKIEELAEILDQSNKSQEVLESIASSWMERLKVFSLFTKHDGFKEEKEWRCVYLKDRDSNGQFKERYGYNISNKGLEPKLKLKLDQLSNGGSALKLELLIDRIILGPTTSSVLAVESVKRMLWVKNKIILLEKVRASTIPYRG